MNVSDVFLDCSRECARLSRECGDKQISAALFEVSARLLSAATRDAELVTDDTHPASQPYLHAGLQSQGSNLIGQGVLAGPQAVGKNTHFKGEIFVLDGDAAMRETLSSALKEAGYEVICFADGAALLSSARIRIPTCIFLECAPGKSGLDLLKKLRAEKYPAPIFVVSGQCDIPTAVDAIKIGALDFITKPIRGSGVVALVTAAIGSPSQAGYGDDCSKISALYLPGRPPLTAGAGGTCADGRGHFQQGTCPATRREFANDRGPSRKHHEKGWCEECDPNSFAAYSACPVIPEPRVHDRRANWSFCSRWRYLCADDFLPDLGH